MKKVIVLSIFLLGVASNSQQVWVQTYNGIGNGSDNGTDVVVDNNSNIYVCGSTWVQGSNDESILVKYNPAGAKLWEQKIGTPNNFMSENATSLALDNQGNIFTAGIYYTGGWPSAFVTKYNPSGVSQWFKVHDRIQYDDAFMALTTDDTGNVYVTGFSEPGFGYDIVIAKYDGAGNTKWIKYYNSFLNRIDRGEDIGLDAAGNVYVAGYQGDSLSSQMTQAILLKYDNAGNLLWKSAYKGNVTGLNEYKSLDIDNLGNVYAGGYTTQGTTNNADVLFAKFNPDGTREWLKTMSGNSGDIVYDIKTDNSFVYITGSLGPDIVTGKYNLAGDQQWQKFYNGPANYGDQGFELEVDNSGNVYSVGMTLPSNFLQDAVIVKYNSAGDQQWADIYSGTSNRFDSFRGVAIDPSGFVVAAGGCENSTNLTSDILVIKYNTVIGISPISNSTPEKYSLSQNYPNPFNPETKLEFQIVNSGLVKLTIFDVLGRAVETLVNEELKAGTYEVSWNASNYPSGVYFYRIVAVDMANKNDLSNFAETRKMMLIK